MAFFGKIDGFSSKISLEFFKNAKLQKRFLKAYQFVLMLKRSQNAQNKDSLGKKGVFFWRKSLTFSKTAICGNFFYRMHLELSYGSKVLKTYKTGIFLEKDSIFKKNFAQISKNNKHGYFRLECVPKVITAQGISKLSKTRLFLEKQINHLKKTFRKRLIS